MHDVQVMKDNSEVHIVYLRALCWASYRTSVKYKVKMAGKRKVQHNPVMSQKVFKPQHVSDTQEESIGACTQRSFTLGHQNGVSWTKNHLEC